MKVVFKVQSLADTHVSVQADVGGELLPVITKCYEVELQSDHNTSLVLKFKGKEIEEAKKVFKSGGSVTWDLSPDLVVAAPTPKSK
jgi:hypothetical protein